MRFKSAPLKKLCEILSQHAAGKVLVNASVAFTSKLTADLLNGAAARS
jgi:hypothetical protein